MTIRTDKSTHILHDPEHSDSCLATKVKFLPHIQQRDFLWRSYDQGTIHIGARRPISFRSLTKERRDTEMFITGARRCINHQEIQLIPINVLNELLYHAVFLGSPPNDRCIGSR